MKDYHIYVHASGSGGATRSPVNPQYHVAENHTTVGNEDERTYRQETHNYTGVLSVGAAVMVASKINGYVGELTENRVASRRFTVGLTRAGLVAGIIKNPAVGIGIAGVYFGDLAISYAIKNYKENLTSDYLRQLSGGTVKTGR